MKKTRSVEWYARAAGIVRIGPFRTQLRATQAVQSINGEPLPAAFVWPEQGTKKQRKG